MTLRQKSGKPTASHHRRQANAPVRIVSRSLPHNPCNQHRPVAFCKALRPNSALEKHFIFCTKKKHMQEQYSEWILLALSPQKFKGRHWGWWYPIPPGAAPIFIFSYIFYLFPSPLASLQHKTFPALSRVFYYHVASHAAFAFSTPYPYTIFPVYFAQAGFHSTWALWTSR